MAAQRLFLYAEWIVDEVLAASTPWYLDLELGRMKGKEHAKGHRVGEGRPDAQRVRFLKIPNLQEESDEIASHLAGPPMKPPRRHSRRNVRLVAAAAIATRN